MKKLLLQFSVVIFTLIVFGSYSDGSKIDGIWESNVNGDYFVVMYSEGEYHFWLNNQLTEIGVFVVDGNTILGMNDNGAVFENTFQLGDDFNHLLVVRQDGSSFLFSRMHINVWPPAVMRRKSVPAIRKCGICHGLGRCTMCFGKGRSYVVGYSGVGSGSYVTCNACNGSGRCWRCDGKGIE